MCQENRLAAGSVLHLPRSRRRPISGGIVGCGGEGGGRGGECLGQLSAQAGERGGGDSLRGIQRNAQGAT